MPMKEIYINICNNCITIKSNKNNNTKIFKNISTKNSENLLKSIKLFSFAVNKIFLDKNFNSNEYLFLINDKIILNYIKKNGFFYKKLFEGWKQDLDLKTYSELGNLLTQLNKIFNKDISYWEITELDTLQDRRQTLYRIQSRYDTETQDILHKIGDLDSINSITSEFAIKYMAKLYDIRKKRDKLKKSIKKIEEMERKLKNE